MTTPVITSINQLQESIKIHILIDGEYFNYEVFIAKILTLQKKYQLDTLFISHLKDEFPDSKNVNCWGIITIYRKYSNHKEAVTELEDLFKN